MSYHAPGRGADMSLFTGLDPRDALTDASILQVLNRPALAQLPTPLAVARVQSPGYHSYSSRAWGHGRYSVVTTRDIETYEDFDRLAALHKIERVAPIFRLLLSRAAHLRRRPPRRGRERRRRPPPRLHHRHHVQHRGRLRAADRL